MDAALLLAGATGLVTALGLIESHAHRRNLARIPIRIHVNGTRGKSGVTRLIAAGLRAGGIRTVAKATGTLPRLVLPDGTDEPIHRPWRANIIEQVSVVRRALHFRPTALVIECMALQPQLQSLCELQLVRATHGVITNARADHLDVMGPTAGDVALALAGTMPQRARCYTAERDRLATFVEAAADRQSELTAITEAEVAAITPAELGEFSYIEHAENVALALRVCLDLGVERSAALAGMWAAVPDSGVMTTHALDLAGRQIVFVNGFAANDPDSTGRNWALAAEYFPALRRRIAVFNCRADRADRSIQLAEACRTWAPADHYLLIGTGTNLFARTALAAGLPRQQLTAIEDANSAEILRHITRLADEGALVMGMGNIGGPGMELVRYVQEHSIFQPDAC